MKREQYDTYRIIREGPTTVAVVQVRDRVGIGIARCMPSDKYSKDIGDNIAIGRAIKDIGEWILEDAKKDIDKWISRSITKADWEAKHRK